MQAGNLVSGAADRGHLNSAAGRSVQPHAPPLAQEAGCCPELQGQTAGPPKARGPSAVSFMFGGHVANNSPSEETLKDFWAFLDVSCFSMPHLPGTQVTREN